MTKDRGEKKRGAFQALSGFAFVTPPREKAAVHIRAGRRQDFDTPTFCGKEIGDDWFEFTETAAPLCRTCLSVEQSDRRAYVGMAPVLEEMLRG